MKTATKYKIKEISMHPGPGIHYKRSSIVGPLAREI